jgi:hypothetical protein
MLLSVMISRLYLKNGIENILIGDPLFYHENFNENLEIFFLKAFLWIK